MSAEQKKVLWDITTFEGPKLGWIEGFLQDYLTYIHMKDGERRMRRETKKTFVYPAGLKVAAT